MGLFKILKYVVTGTTSTQSAGNAGHRRHSTINLPNRQQPGQPGQTQSPRAFLTPSNPTFHAPGIVGQVIVRTNGPANAEVIMTFHF